MERRINKKIHTYLQSFKSDIVDIIKSSSANEIEVVNYIYNYNKLEINKDDLVKRKRIKNTVPLHEKCCAKRANGEQCTRRKKNNSNYCGTHVKGTPHGVINDDNSNVSNETTIKKELQVVDIKGIVHYIDDINNVYNTSDVLANRENPRIVANYQKKGGDYEITSYI
jgi:hypothetical protein